jgi:hypothetical protein
MAMLGWRAVERNKTSAIARSVPASPGSRGRQFARPKAPGGRDGLTQAFFAFLVLLASAAAAIAAQGDGYPARPVRFIVATAAGGNVDMVARLVGNKLTESLGRAFVVDNRGGAGGVIAERSPCDHPRTATP